MYACFPVLFLLFSVARSIVIMQYEGAGCKGAYTNHSINSSNCYFDGELQGLTSPRSFSTTTHNCVGGTPFPTLDVTVAAQGVCPFKNVERDASGKVISKETENGNVLVTNDAAPTPDWLKNKMYDSFIFHKEYAHSLCIDGVLGPGEDGLATHPSERNLFAGGSLYNDCSTGSRPSVGVVLLSVLVSLATLALSR